MKKVKKTWGEEHWIINRAYCGKLLILNKGYQCSLHYHKEKDETFYINSGKVLMNVDGKKKIMRKGDIQHIKPGVVHQFTGMTDSEIIEFSTHHKDSDSYRLTTSQKTEI